MFSKIFFDSFDSACFDFVGKDLCKVKQISQQNYTITFNADSCGKFWKIAIHLFTFVNKQNAD